MMTANFMDLHGIQNMCLHYRIIHKTTRVYTIHIEKELRFTRYQSSYIIIQDGFFWLSGLEGEL